MSFLKRAIRDGIRKGVGDAIGKVVQQAVEPTATRLTNQATDSFNQLTGQVQQSQQVQQARRQTGDLEAAFGKLQRSMEDYATETAKNVKICPAMSPPPPTRNSAPAAAQGCRK